MNASKVMVDTLYTTTVTVITIKMFCKQFKLAWYSQYTKNRKYCDYHSNAVYYKQ